MIIIGIIFRGVQRKYMVGLNTHISNIVSLTH